MSLTSSIIKPRIKIMKANEEKRQVITLRLSAADLELIKSAQAKKGIFNRQEFIRLSIRAFSKAILDGKI